MVDASRRPRAGRLDGLADCALRGVALERRYSNAAVTVAVGWFIQETLRRRGELDRVPIEAVTRISERLESLIGECSATAARSEPNETLLALTRLGNEIDWLARVAASLGVPDSSEITDLKNQRFALKGLLTDSPAGTNLMAAENLAREMRLRALKIHWALCERVLANPAGLAKL